MNAAHIKQIRNSAEFRIHFIIYGFYTSDRTLYAIGTEAPRAHVDMAGAAVHDSLDPLYIGLPSLVGAPV